MRKILISILLVVFTTSVGLGQYSFTTQKPLSLINLSNMYEEEKANLSSDNILFWGGLTLLAIGTYMIIEGVLDPDYPNEPTGYGSDYYDEWDDYDDDYSDATDRVLTKCFVGLGIGVIGTIALVSGHYSKELKSNKLFIGAPKEHVRKILGYPDSVFSGHDEFGNYDFWHYGNMTYYFKNGKLVEWYGSR